MTAPTATLGSSYGDIGDWAERVADGLQRFLLQVGRAKVAVQEGNEPEAKVGFPDSKQSPN